MSRHIDFGHKGEDLAATWLTDNGYTVITRNWKHPGGEIDIICTRNGFYHFIEVKTGKTHTFGPPEIRVSRTKMRRIMTAATAWLYRHGLHEAHTRYDVLAISIPPGSPPEFYLIADIHP